jgi:hypothetical protein
LHADEAELLVADLAQERLQDGDLALGLQAGLHPAQPAVAFLSGTTRWQAAHSPGSWAAAKDRQAMQYDLVGKLPHEKQPSQLEADRGARLRAIRRAEAIARRAALG